MAADVLEAREAAGVSEPLTLDAALASYGDCTGYTWRHIEYKGVSLEVVCDG